MLWSLLVPVFSMEEITRSWNNLSLDEREGSRITLKNSSRSSDFILAAKFFTKRVLNMDAVARTFRQLWRSTAGFKIRNMHNNVVLFIFNNQGDIDRILRSEPWCFDKHLVALHQYDGDIHISEINFQWVSFWVQVHDIPIRFMTREVTENICDTVGTVCQSSGGVDEDGGRFMRVKVKLDILLPLCRGRVVTLESGKTVWVNFKYERLPNFCYWCGRLTHSDKECPLWIQSKGTLTVDQRQFSQTLRAPPHRATNKPIVFVPGYYDDLADSSPNEGDGGIGGQRVVDDSSGENTAGPQNPVMEMDTHEEVINAGVNVPCSVSFPGNASHVVNAHQKESFPSVAGLSPKGRGEDFVSDENGRCGGEVSKGKWTEKAPSNTGPFAEGDPFLAKLQEIDRALHKYDVSPGSVVTNGLSSGLGPFDSSEELAQEGLFENRMLPPSPQNRGVLHDITNIESPAQAHLSRKKLKNPKLKPTKSSELCGAKSPALKRLLPYHDEANPQPQKKRVIIPNDNLVPDVIPAAAEPQPRHGQ